jgi:hypothetical protein
MAYPPASTNAPAAAGHAEPEFEPKTPMWLPALGAALFVSAGLWWAVTPAPPPPAPAEPAASAPAPAPPPQAMASAGAPMPPMQRVVPPMASGSASAARANLPQNPQPGKQPPLPGGRNRPKP